jgi:hypothetical protein
MSSTDRIRPQDIVTCRKENVRFRSPTPASRSCSTTTIGFGDSGGEPRNDVNP